jgi:hypothetical protein
MPQSLMQYQTGYTSSWAVVIGINRYQHMPPLHCAASDAGAVARMLIDRFGFPRQQVILLQDSMATRDNILSIFDNLASKRLVGPDDRLMVYFAGHGITRDTRDGSIVGYLAPIDAEPSAWRSLIRMTDLISQARFLSAKHVLFILDACYSGLSLRRGSSFDPILEMLLTRPAIQVMTAGRADEQVVDGGDAEGDNSIFTGYLLDALSGEAATASGLMTASDVMNYVYRHVTGNPFIEQTPQYGWLDGDGDFVFQFPHRGALPMPVEMSLRQGSVAGRLASVNELTTIASTPGNAQTLAVQRLHDVAVLDPDPRVSGTAERVLGLPASRKPTRPAKIDPPPQFVVDPRPTIPTRRTPQAPVPWIVMAAAGIVLVVGFALALYGIMLSRETPALATEQVVATTELVAITTVDQPIVMETDVATLDPSTVGPGRSVNSSLIFYDDFSQSLAGWEGLPDDGRVARVLRDQQMEFTVFTGYARWITQPSRLSMGDGIIEVTGVTPLAQPGSSFGLIFRKIDLDNYYYYQVSADGTYSVILQKGGLISYLIEAKPLGASAFDGQPHRLAVQMSGSSFDLYFDNRLIGSAQDGRIGAGYAGLAVETREAGPLTVQFDDFGAYTP